MNIYLNTFPVPDIKLCALYAFLIGIVIFLINKMEAEKHLDSKC